MRAPLQQALAAVPLAGFYLALGRAYGELPDLPEAQTILQQGLASIVGKNDDNHEARFANLLGVTLKAKGDLDGALTYAERALKIDEKSYGPDHPEVAIDANNLGAILRAKGDLDGALTYAQRALKIHEKVYGPNPEVAIDANNIGLILKDKGDLDGALTYAERALDILTRTYGPDNPRTRIVAANLEKIKLARSAKPHVIH